MNGRSEQQEKSKALQYPGRLHSVTVWVSAGHPAALEKLCRLS